MKIGLNIFSGPGLGDMIIQASLPENFYKNIREKLIDVGCHFIFDYNPYVIRGKNPDIIYTNQQIQDGARTTTDNKKIRVLSIADRLRYFFNLPECYLRHPRLYKYEDSETIFNKITVHTTAKTIGGIMDDKVIEAIKSNYKRYEIFQVGGLKDKNFPGATDLRGVGFWETAAHIAESAIFIGIDSSMGHIASCYPKVRRKMIINYIDEEKFKWANPLFEGEAWWDFNVESYNCYDRDIGATMSYLKI